MIKPAYNNGLAKVAIQSSADIFVVNQSLVLRINICSENCHLRQVANRYASLLGDRSTINNRADIGSQQANPSQN